MLIIGITFFFAVTQQSLAVPTTYTDIDLSTFTTGPSAGYKILGATAHDSNGWSVDGVVDFNKDGFPDVLVGAMSASPSGRASAGIGYVLLTNSTGSVKDIDLQSFSSGAGAGLKVYGKEYDASFHSTVSLGDRCSHIGDVNGDGFGDVAFGAFGDDYVATGHRYDSGLIVVLFGGNSTSLYSTIDTLTFTPSTARGYQIRGAGTDSFLGRSVSEAGDFNGDGIDDFVVMAAGENGGRGYAYVIFGKRGSVADIDLGTFTTSSTNGFIIMGENGSDGCGIVSGAGDVNKDGISDLVIGCPTADPNARGDAGATFVIYGRRTGIANMVLGWNSFTSSATNGFSLFGAVSNDRLGRAVSDAGDFNGDGYADVLIGAHIATFSSKSEAGAAYVLFGLGTARSPTDANSFTSSDTLGFRMLGSAAGDRLGWAVSGAGDINADGRDDIVVGAYVADANSKTDCGVAYVVFGKSSGNSEIDFASFTSGTLGYRILGATAGFNTGFAVANLGDINRDGVADIAVGAVSATAAGRTKAGITYVLFGIALEAPTHKPSSAPTTMPTRPTARPTAVPTRPTARPTALPTSAIPTSQPSRAPSSQPSRQPSRQPSSQPSIQPSVSALTLSTYRSSPTYKTRNGFAFAARDTAGRVHTWGEAGYGGDSSTVHTHLQSNVLRVTASAFAFTALKADGSMKTWGAQVATANVPATAVSLVVANEAAFAGIAVTGTGVVPFGSRFHGGDFGDSHCTGCESALTTGVSAIVASAGAFAAVKTDGTVYSWGSSLYGAGVSSITMSGLNRVVRVTASRGAFAALLETGRVMTWGDQMLGGDSSAVQAHLLADVVHVIASRSVFVAFKDDSSIVVWGHPMYGGDTRAVASQLTGHVTFVTHTFTAMAALKSDRTVVTWGKADGGGDSSSAQASLHNIVKIYGNSKSFAAVTATGAVVTWGRNGEGGNIPASKISALSSGVLSIFSTNKAFAALKSDGSVVVWGQMAHGGVPSEAVKALLTSGVHTICTNEVAFSAIKTSGVVVAWGHTASIPVDGVLFNATGLATPPTCA